MLERLAMKDKMPRAVAVKLGVKLVQMRAAWQILEASRTDLVKEIGTDKQGMVTDNERFSTEWNDVLDTEVDTIKVRPFTGEPESLFGECDVSAADFAAMYTLGLLVEVEEG
jgi:hypothetical protein